MWSDHPFNQRKHDNRKNSGRVGGDREVGVGVCGQNLKKGCRGRQYRRGVFIK